MKNGQQAIGNRQQPTGNRVQGIGCREGKLTAWCVFTFGVLFLSVFFFHSPVLALKFPKATGYVNDFADVIPAAQQDEIESLLRRVEKKTTAEIVLVSVKECAPMDSFTYRQQLFQEWGIGKAKKDNGLLLLLCLKERRIEIEVGYGLEGVITDGIAGEVLDKYVRPDFKLGNFGDGFLRGTQAIASRMLGGKVEMPSVSEHYVPPASSGQVPIFISVLIVAGLIAIVFLVSYYGKPPCPKCNLRKFVKRRRTDVISHATYHSSGMKDVTYYCSQCDYEWTRRETIPRLQQSSSSGGGWSSGGGGFGGFGGGSSGGGGAGRGF